MVNCEINEQTIPPNLEPSEDITLWRYMSFSTLCEIIMYDYIPLINVCNFPDKSECSAYAYLDHNFAKLR